MTTVGDLVQIKKDCYYFPVWDAVPTSFNKYNTFSTITYLHLVAKTVPLNNDIPRLPMVVVDQSSVCYSQQNAPLVAKKYLTVSFVKVLLFLKQDQVETFWINKRHVDPFTGESFMEETIRKVKSKVAK